MGNKYISIDLDGKTLSYNEDILFYSQVSEKFNQHIICLCSELAHWQRKGLYPSYVHEKLSNTLMQDAGEIISFLCKKEIYEYSVDSFTSINEYTLLNMLCSAFLETKSEINRALASMRENEIAHITLKAQSEMESLGFGILSSSMLSHTVYAAQTALNDTKQERVAQQKINEGTEVVDRRENELNSKYTSELLDSFYKQYVRAVIGCLITWENQFIDILKNQNIISPDCLASVDKNKSDDILSNFNLADDKIAVIKKALEACPFNISAYKKAIDSNIFNQEMANIALAFNVHDELSNYLRSLYTIEESCELFYKQYERSIQLLANLQNKELCECLNKVFSEKIERVKGFYQEIRDVVKVVERVGDGDNVDVSPQAHPSKNFNGYYPQFNFTDFLKKYNIDLTDSITTEWFKTQIENKIFSLSDSMFISDNTSLKVEETLCDILSLPQTMLYEEIVKICSESVFAEFGCHKGSKYSNRLDELNNCKLKAEARIQECEAGYPNCHKYSYIYLCVGIGSLIVGALSSLIFLMLVGGVSSISAILYYLKQERLKSNYKNDYIYYDSELEKTIADLHSLNNLYGIKEHKK